MNLDNDNPAATRRRIDALCDAFEAAWRAGQRPRVEAELEKIESATRHELLKELLLDLPLHDGRQGWVSQLYRHLSERMEQLSGERIKRPPSPLGWAKELRAVGAEHQAQRAATSRLPIPTPRLWFPERNLRFYVGVPAPTAIP